MVKIKFKILPKDNFSSKKGLRPKKTVKFKCQRKLNQKIPTINGRQWTIFFAKRIKLENGTFSLFAIFAPINPINR